MAERAPCWVLQRKPRFPQEISNMRRSKINHGRLSSNLRLLLQVLRDLCWSNGEGKQVKTTTTQQKREMQRCKRKEITNEPKRR